MELKVKIQEAVGRGGTWGERWKETKVLISSSLTLESYQAAEKTYTHSFIKITKVSMFYAIFLLTLNGSFSNYYLLERILHVKFIFYAYLLKVKLST